MLKVLFHTRWLRAACCTLLVLCVASLSPSELVSPALAASELKENETLKAFYKSVRALVKEYFPKANVVEKENTFHFELKLRRQTGFYTGRLVLAPDSGGILGDIALKPGVYDGKEYKVKHKEWSWIEEQEGYHTTLMLAPYSKERHEHLFTRIMLPTDTPIEFKERFKELILSFGKEHEAQSHVHHHQETTAETK